MRVSCLLTLAMADLALSGFAAASARLEQAFALAGTDPELRARCQCQRGNVLLQAGEFAEAARDLAVAESEPQWFSTRERAVIGVSLGVVSFELGRPDEAIRAEATAADIAREAGDDRLLFMAEHNRGYHRYLTGDLPGALAAMAAAEELDADVFRGTSLFALARVLGEAGLLDQAVGALDRAEAACRPRVDRMLRAEIERERAVLLRLAGEFTEAAASARSALSRFQQLGAPGPAATAALIVLDCDLSRGRRLGRVLENSLSLGEVARGLGDTDLAARSSAVAAEAAAR
ncbi:hypothetical protein, partial [Propionicimonas sp.]|uniref:hypothetical protein n=1 Tax=Propionicimonas sp. TaxID=1955623 RepID=UPI0039E28B28